MKYTDILGVNFINGSIEEAVEKALRVAEEHRSAYVVAPDSEMMIAAGKDLRYMRTIQEADLCLPEGNGVMYAANILGSPLKSRISALDFASALMARMAEKNMSIFILGRDYDMVETAGLNIQNRYPGIELVGTDDGYFDNEIELYELINKANPDLLLVGYGSLVQEKWMNKSKNELNVGLMIGFGDELPVVAGSAERAPKRWRDSGFEWLYWLLKDPKRFGRMVKRTNIVFTAAWRRLVG